MGSEADARLVIHSEEGEPGDEEDDPQGTQSLWATVHTPSLVWVAGRFSVTTRGGGTEILHLWKRYVASHPDPSAGLQVGPRARRVVPTVSRVVGCDPADKEPSKVTEPPAVSGADTEVTVGVTVDEYLRVLFVESPQLESRLGSAWWRPQQPPPPPSSTHGAGRRPLPAGGRSADGQC